ncbi:MFS transporter [Bradyrhizobium canariense]|uniref:Predicted arabinose efflux permease, MFS family n=1 Tax=Bradyrhizobium canariense TaxID=255045 RepID=A0A1H1XNR4_9BRAD|nr:MFS transporter [Bradyrhizobium canariense]SDT10865.1 Predicted arabinose efflux permease, MFS family [Bradyrhizobium canariense]
MEVAAGNYTGKEKASVLISTFLGYGLDFYNVMIVAFLMGAIQKDLNITLTQAGIITSVTLAGSILGGVAFGWLGDRFGRKASLQMTLGFFSFGAILSAFSWDFTSLLVFRAIAGIGLGGEWGAGEVLFNEVWDRKKRGFGSSLIQAASTGGFGMAAVVAVWATNSFSPEWGWRVALLIGGSPILLMVYIRISMPESRLWTAYNDLRKSGELPVEKQQARNPLIEIFKGGSLRYTVLGVVLVSGYMFAYYSIAVFMPRVMTSAGASPESMRTITLVLAITVAVSYVILGYFSDKIGRKAAVILPTLLSLIGFAGMYYAAKSGFPESIWLWPLFGWYMLWGMGQTCAGMFGPWFAELFPVESRSSAVSTIYMIGRGVGSVAPFVVPAVVPAVGGELINAMMVGLPATAFCLLAALLLPETAGRSFAVVESKARPAA